MVEHTPGPWEFSRGYNGEFIVTVSPDNDIIFPDHEDDSVEWEANARLIALAPKMYEALQEVASGGCCQTEGCSPDYPCCDAMMAKAVLDELEEKDG